jgi:hypothetical protein
MTYDRRAMDPISKTGAEFRPHDCVRMKPPAYPTPGVVVDGAPIVVGGVRYWRVAWSFGGEKRVTWSPESAFHSL